MSIAYIRTFLLIVFMHSSICKIINPPKIAIVGAGIGGASSAYFLRELFGDDGASIDVYEKNVIGGRLATAEVDGQYFEVGGSVIHPKNVYLTKFMKKFGLQKRTGGSSSFALFDGEKFIFESSNWYIVNVWKILWRYGFNLPKLEKAINEILKVFDHVYELQNERQSFRTVKELLHAMSPSFVDALTNSTYHILKKRDFSDQTIDEIVRAALRVNYGQDVDIHFFVGSVSLAGTADELFSIRGGNKQVPEKLLEHADANLIPGEVQSITLNPNPDMKRYLLNYTIHHPEIPANIGKGEFYDIVIFATPLTDDINQRVQFLNFPKKFQFPGSYHRTVCTLVNGELNSDYFGTENLISDILTINDTFFNSVSLINNVNYSGESEHAVNVWKVFSQNVLSVLELSKLFKHIRTMKVFDWKAYPEYSTENRWDTFVLDDYLYHVNAIEWAASAMEMSAIGAKNVALLAFETWSKMKKAARIEKSINNQRTEL